MTMLYVYGVVRFSESRRLPADRARRCERVRGPVRRLRRRREQSVPPHHCGRTRERVVARAGSGSAYAAARRPAASFRDACSRCRNAPEPPCGHASRTRRQSSTVARQGRIRAARHRCRCRMPARGRCCGDERRRPDASPGTRYLRARAERRRHRIAFEDAARGTERALRRHLDPTAESAAWGLAAARSTTLVASYLVPRKDASAFAAAVADVRAHHPALKISCTGPWAPYSFVTVRPPEA